MTAAVVRTARAQDVAVLLALERGVQAAPHWSAEGYTAMVGSTRHGVLVAEAGPEVCGFGVVSIAADEAELESIVVGGPWQRQGIGLLLMQAMIAHAKERGAVRMFLEVRAGNVAARALYAATGFEQVGMRRGYYSAPVEDAVVMRRPL